VPSSSLKTKKTSIIRVSFRFIISIINSLLLALIISLAITLIYSIFYGTFTTTLTLYELIHHETLWLDTYVPLGKTNQFVIQQAENISECIQHFQRNCQNAKIFELLNYQHHPSAAYEYANSLYFTFIKYFSPLLLSTAFVILKIAAIYFFWPIYFVFTVMGLIDGVTQRYLRKEKGGRESTLMYHYAVSIFKPALLTSIVVYIVLPFSVNPAIVLLPGAIGLLISVFFAAKMFKKYL
jgi:integrating conjugative element membrane protein (TIGR03747 family)